MKNSEDLSTHKYEYPVSSIELTGEIKAKITEILNDLKSILANDIEFADELITQSFLLGKGVFSNEIRNLLFDTYPDLYQHEGGARLVDITYDLGKLICCNESLTKQIIYDTYISLYPNTEALSGSDEERIVNDIENKLRENIIEFINHTWERDDLTTEASMLGVTNEFNDLDM